MWRPFLLVTTIVCATMGAAFAAGEAELARKMSSQSQSSDPATKAAAPERKQDKQEESPSGASPEASHDLFQLLKNASNKKPNGK